MEEYRDGMKKTSRSYKSLITQVSDPFLQIASDRQTYLLPEDCLTFRNFYIYSSPTNKQSKFRGTCTRIHDLSLQCLDTMGHQLSKEKLTLDSTSGQFNYRSCVHTMAHIPDK
jgi:hypothetical protein